MQVGLTGTISRIRFPSRSEALDADLASLRAQYALDSRLSAAAFVQYNRLARTTAANLRIRWQIAEGRDLWVVYNDLLNTERERGIIGPTRLPLSQARTLLVKYTQTFAR